MDVSRGLTVGSHHEAPDRWIPAEGGEDRAIVGGVVLMVQAFGGGLILAGDLNPMIARTSTGRALAIQDD